MMLDWNSWYPQIMTKPIERGPYYSIPEELNTICEFIIQPRGTGYIEFLKEMKERDQ